MTDYTPEIAELTAAYNANRVANAAIATEVKSRYRTIIADEIRDRKLEADIKFAKHLARVKERTGLPLSVIQDHILHTKTWSRWVYWRDLANIAPERVAVEGAKTAAKIANQGWRWEEDEAGDFGYVLILDRDAKGREIDEFRIREFTKNSDGSRMAFPSRDAETRERAKIHFGDIRELAKFASRIVTENWKEVD